MDPGTSQYKILSDASTLHENLHYIQFFKVFQGPDSGP